MKGSGARTLIVGLDGATWDLADRFIAEGRMPNLAPGQRGCARSVERPSPPMTLPSWSSMLTGCNPDVMASSTLSKGRGPLGAGF